MTHYIRKLDAWPMGNAGEVMAGCEMEPINADSGKQIGWRYTVPWTFSTAAAAPAVPMRNPETFALDEIEVSEGNPLPYRAVLSSMGLVAYGHTEQHARDRLGEALRLLINALIGNGDENLQSLVARFDRAGLVDVENQATP